MTNETYQDLEPVYNKNQINNMKNMFFYTTKRQLQPKEGETEPQFGEFRDSMNLNKVIRSITNVDGSVIVILDDFNERVQEVPDINTKTNKFNGYKKVRETVQSEIILTHNDGERFFKLTN